MVLNGKTSLDTSGLDFQVNVLLNPRAIEAIVTAGDFKDENGDFLPSPVANCMVRSHDPKGQIFYLQKWDSDRVANPENPWEYKWAYLAGRDLVVKLERNTRNKPHRFNLKVFTNTFHPKPLVEWYEITAND